MPACDRRQAGRCSMVKWSEGRQGPVSELEDLQRFSNEHVNQGKIAQAPNWLHTNVDGESQGLTRIQPVLKEFAKELSYIEVQRETIG